MMSLDAFPFWPDYGLFILNTRARHLGLPKCRAFTLPAILAWRNRWKHGGGIEARRLYIGAALAAAALERDGCYLSDQEPPRQFVRWQNAQGEWWEDHPEQPT
jgi:hypothetical protein